MDGRDTREVLQDPLRGGYGARPGSRGKRPVEQPLTARHQQQAALKVLQLGVLPQAGKRRLLGALREVTGEAYAPALERVLHELVETAGWELDYRPCLTGGEVEVRQLSARQMGGIVIRPSIDLTLPKRNAQGGVTLDLSLSEHSAGQEERAGNSTSETVGRLIEAASGQVGAAQQAAAVARLLETVEVSAREREHLRALLAEAKGAYSESLAAALVMVAGKAGYDVTTRRATADGPLELVFERMREGPGSAPSAEEVVARSFRNVANSPHIMDESLQNEFLRVAAMLFPNLTETECRALLNEGYLRDDAARRAKAYDALSAAQPDRPVPYSERPPGMKFVEFMRREYRDKGILGRPGFTLRELREMDRGLADTYYKQLQRNGVPHDILIGKARRRLNRRERTGPS